MPASSFGIGLDVLPDGRFRILGEYVFEFQQDQVTRLSWLEDALVIELVPNSVERVPETRDE